MQDLSTLIRDELRLAPAAAKAKPYRTQILVAGSATALAVVVLRRHVRRSR